MFENMWKTHLSSTTQPFSSNISILLATGGRGWRLRAVLLNTSYGLRGVLFYGGFAAADTSQKTVIKYKLWASRRFVLWRLRRRGHLPENGLFWKKHVLRANQASYVGGKERARNLLQDAPENDSVAARRAELWRFEGSQVPQHDIKHKKIINL